MKRITVYALVAIVFVSFTVIMPTRSTAGEIQLKAATAFSSHTDWEKGFWLFY